jgi:ElaB/YqjD/DUF883 family membrane-anchored ribosome-binding protein
VPIVFEERLYEELKKVASSRGISVSALIREIALKYLSSISNTASSAQVSDPPADPPQRVDLVVKMDIEELEEEVREVEGAVRRVEELLERSSELPRGLAELWVKNNRARLQDTLVRAENKLKRLRQRYYSVKRRARGCAEVEELASRMYALRNIINQLKARLK